MKIRITFGYIVAFLLLQIIMLELHETVHIVTGYFICGCWGNRDFNVWALCTDCNIHHSMAWLATLAGPLFSFAIMRLGMVWLSSKNERKQALGFSLIFTSIPLGRLSEAMRGSGDEMIVGKHLMKNDLNLTQITIICSLLIAILVVPPVIKAYRFLRNKNGCLYVIGYLILPLCFILIYTLVGMNSLLHTGFLANVFVAGTPLLITLHTVLAIAILWLLRKHLYKNFYKN